MANPTIQSITPPGPVTAVVGTQVVLTVTATDADARTETLVVSVKDLAGNLSVPQEVPLVFTDPLTVEAHIKESGSPTQVLVAGNKITVVG